MFLTSSTHHPVKTFQASLALPDSSLRSTLFLFSNFASLILLINSLFIPVTDVHSPFKRHVFSHIEYVWVIWWSMVYYLENSRQFLFVLKFVRKLEYRMWHCQQLHQHYHSSHHKTLANQYNQSTPSVSLSCSGPRLAHCESWVSHDSQAACIWALGGWGYCPTVWEQVYTLPGMRQGCCCSIDRSPCSGATDRLRSDVDQAGDS